jgi:hypothetical protein
MAVDIPPKKSTERASVCLAPALPRQATAVATASPAPNELERYVLRRQTERKEIMAATEFAAVKGISKLRRLPETTCVLAVQQLIWARRPEIAGAF